MRVLDLLERDERPIEETARARLAARGLVYDDAYAITDDALYENALELVRRLLADEWAPSLGTRDVSREVLAIPAADWKLAAEPYSEDMTMARLRKRAVALEAARRLFTAVAREQNGQAFSLHIRKAKPGQRSPWYLGVNP